MEKKKSIIRKIAIENMACSGALEWLDKHKNKPDEWLWEHSARPDWMVWLLRHSIDLPKETWVRIAVTCAESVIEIYEEKYPEDSLPRKAIKAAKAWLANPTSAAADAAYAAADACAYAVYTANAGNAAYDAAYAAAAAAYAAAAAAYAAAAADYVPAADAAYAAANAAAYAAYVGNADVYTSAAHTASKAVDAISVATEKISGVLPWGNIVLKLKEEQNEKSSKK